MKITKPEKKKKKKSKHNCHTKLHGVCSTGLLPLQSICASQALRISPVQCLQQLKEGALILWIWHQAMEKPKDLITISFFMSRSL